MGHHWLSLKENGIEKKKILKIRVSQINSNKKNIYNDLPLIIPINISIFLNSYKKISKTLILKEKKKNSL